MEEHDVRVRFERLRPFLDERGRRLFAANEAMSLGRGGVATVSVATGLARSTIDRGIAELRGGQDEIDGAIRRPGAGRKPAEEGQPGLLAALEGLIEGAIRGDPETPLRWVSRSQRHLAEAMRSEGFKVSQKLVGSLLKKLNYSCQANRKTREGSNHPDRNAQFEHINAMVRAAMAAGEPSISVDTKKKELVGDFKNGGRELRRKGDPEPVRVHDFKIKSLGKVAPYGVYDMAANEGWVNVGIDAAESVLTLTAARSRSKGATARIRAKSSHMRSVCQAYRSLIWPWSACSFRLCTKPCWICFQEMSCFQGLARSQMPVH